MKMVLILLSFFHVIDCTYAFIGDGMPIADFCNGSMMPFTDTASVLPGNNVTITCSLPDSTITWSSSLSSVPSVTLSLSGMTTGTILDGAIVFNLTEIQPTLPCITATATIANISESMQGLGLTCVNGFATLSSTVNIDVIDPPLPVTASVSNCTDITVSWSDPSSASTCPITGYSVVVNSSIEGFSIVPLIATDLSYTIESPECGEVFVFTVTAENVVGPSEPSISVTGQRICCPSGLGVTGIWDTQNYFFGVEWDNCGRSEVTGFVASVTGPNIPTEPPPTVEMTLATLPVGGFDVMYSITVSSVNAAMEVCNSETKTVDVSGVLFGDYKIVTGQNSANISFSYSGITISNIVTNDTGRCSTDYNSTHVFVSCTQLTPGQTFSLIITINTSEGMQYLVITDFFIEPTSPTSPVSSSHIAASSMSTSPTGDYVGDDGCNYGFAVGLTASLTFLVTTVLYSLLTLLVTSCLCVRGKEKKTTATGPVPLYEIPTTDIGKESLEVSPNAAYGHVQPRSTAHASSMYDNMAL